MPINKRVPTPPPAPPFKGRTKGVIPPKFGAKGRTKGPIPQYQEYKTPPGGKIPFTPRDGYKVTRAPRGGTVPARLEALRKKAL